MADNKTTTLTLTAGTKKDLDDLKIHPRQSYEEVIKTIIKKVKGDPNLAQGRGDGSNSDERKDGEEIKNETGIRN